jgi:hypothetical protein
LVASVGATAVLFGRRQMEDAITVKQAYLAMYSFLDELYTKYEFDQLGASWAL